jgi:hypothetical protein
MFSPNRRSGQDVVHSCLNANNLATRPWRGLDGSAQFYSRSHDAVIRVHDETGNVIETREHGGDFKEP